jgi:uncharacterized protein YggE
VGKGIRVTGSGRASGPRDECSITVGSEVQASTAREALARSADSLGRMREALLAGGIPASALATSAVSLNPVYQEYPTVAGFSAAVRLTATSRDLTGVGDVLTTVVAAGGDAARLHQVTYRHSDTSALARTARRAAWEDALARATQLAELAGRTLGDVLNVEETGGGSARPVAAQRMAMDMSESAPTLDAGEERVTVTLTVRWSLR